jgi:hypothetical protein
MNVVNISRLGNKIKGLNVLGINTEGLFILSGIGNKLHQGYANRLVFYLYNPVTGEVKADLFSDLQTVNIIFSEFLCKHYLGNGIGYYLEAENEQKANIVKCDFNHNTYVRLFSICISDTCIDDVHLFALSGRYLAIKLYNQKTCEIKIYDLREHNKYNLSFPDNDDMRYADIHYINVNESPHVLLIKYAKSDWKMEYYTHKWEWTPQFISWKDEKIFLFSLNELISKGSIYLNDTWKIVQIGETHQLQCRGLFKDCLVYSYEDLRKYDEESPAYKDEIFFYDVRKARVIKSICYQDHLLISSNGGMYELKKEHQCSYLEDMSNHKVYPIPYERPWIKNIIKDYLSGKLIYVSCQGQNKDTSKEGLLNNSVDGLLSIFK